MAASGARQLLAKQLMAAREISRGGNVDAMMQWDMDWWTGGVGSTVVWVRRDWRVGLGFSGGSSEGGGIKESQSTHISFIIMDSPRT